MTNCGGIILCGGQSRRMGQPKALLPFGDESMLERVVRIVGSVVHPLYVVAAPDAPLPNLGGLAQLVYDRPPQCGPLGGLAVGLEALASQAEAAFVVACDVPLVKPEFTRLLCAQLSVDYDAVAPLVDGRPHPLSAVYRTSLLPRVRLRIDQGLLRMTDLLTDVRTLLVRRELLVAVDPALDSLRNVNDPQEYQAALALAGLV